MKKLLVTFISLLSLTFSGGAFAGTQMSDDDANTPGINDSISSGTGNDCELLSENVTVNLSQNVEGGYDCTTTANVIGIATCHPNGRIDASSNNFIYKGSSAGGSVVGSQDAVCTAANAAAQATVAAGSQ